MPWVVAIIQNLLLEEHGPQDYRWRITQMSRLCQGVELIRPIQFYVEQSWSHNFCRFDKIQLRYSTVIAIIERAVPFPDWSKNQNARFATNFCKNGVLLRHGAESERSALVLNYLNNLDRFLGSRRALRDARQDQSLLIIAYCYGLCYTLCTAEIKALVACPRPFMIWIMICST